MIISFPLVSVIVPVKNEEKNIQLCLNSIINQTYPKEKLEIIIIDARSEDKTLQIINQKIDENSNLNIKVINDDKSQRSAGLNKGIKKSNGDIVLRIDARTIISNDYIEKNVETLLTTGADNVGGLQKPIPISSDKPVQSAIALAMSYPFGVGNAQFRLAKKSGFVDSIYLGCFRRNIFDRIGYFDEDSPVITEDSDINYRIRKSGGKVYLNHEISALYAPRDSLRDLSRLYFRYGGARAGFMLKWKMLTGFRQLVPPVFLLTLLILPLLGFMNFFFIYLWLFFVVIYLIMDFLASLLIAFNNHIISTFKYLIFAFPIMHFSWAVGFLYRVIQRSKTNYWRY